MNVKQLSGLTRRAIENYNMLDEGDIIAVGLSGGKDSMSLLYILNELSKYHPSHFKVEAFTVDIGFGNMDFDKLAQYCRQLNVPFNIIHTQIADIVFNSNNSNSPCAVCSKLRKGALYSELVNRGIKKVAYAHHKDDVTDTLLLSLIYEGRINTFIPVTHLEDSDIIVLRPFIYVNESDIKGFINKYNIPILKNSCPVDGYTKRKYVNDLINSINKETHGVRNRMLTAIENSGINGWKTEVKDGK